MITVMHILYKFLSKKNLLLEEKITEIEKIGPQHLKTVLHLLGLYQGSITD